MRGFSKAVGILGALAVVGVLRLSGLPVLAQEATPVVGPPQAGTAVTYRVSWKTTADGDEAGSGAALVALRWRTGDRVVASFAPAPTPASASASGSASASSSPATPPSIYVLTRAADGRFSFDHLYGDDADGARLARAIGTLNDVSLVLGARPAAAPHWTVTVPLRPQVVGSATAVAPVDAVLTASETTAAGGVALTATGKVTVQPGGSRAAQLLQRLEGQAVLPTTSAAEIHAQFAPDGVLETESLVETTTVGSGKDANVVVTTWQVARIP